MTELPLSYRIPLDGITLIEASAGTGKTHTLIRIMARHLLWYNRPIDQILAVTFTEAATTELKSRLRDFLYELKHYFAHPYGNEDIDALFSNAPEHITETELYFRITHAIANIDKAAVFTIHGFCQRLLNEQPLLTGQSIPSPQFIEIQHALIEQICQEFWRQRNLDANGAEALQATWASPAHMQRMVADLLSSAKLTPERPAHLVKPDFDLAYSQFKAVFQEHAVEAKQLLLQAIENKILSGVSHKIKKTEEQFVALTHFFQHGHRSTSLDLSQIATSKLKTNANKACPNHPLFDAADQWLLFADSYQLYQENLSLCLLHDFRVFLRQRLNQLKMQRNQMSFDDLIDRLHLALQSLQGQQLAEIIRKAYPVALVDEFQDTDDRQWAIFKSIYFNQDHTNLILIGDPKQAIYAFRGGDIHTYLNASESATHHETLHGNYRSNQALLTAVDCLFTHQHPHPFYEQGIDFIPVDAMKKPGHVWIGDEKLEPIQFIKVGSSDTEKKLSKSLATLHCAQQCATQVAWLVHEIDAGNAFVRTEDSTHPLNHHDIVILVATHQQAKLMQDRLLAHAVRSVCVDKSNVFDSYEALDVLNILRLLTNPSGWQLQQNAAHGVLLQCITGCQDFSMFDVSTYQELMIKQGVLACFNALLTSIEQAVLALPFGERRLSNYWQLVELIQQQYTQTQSGIEIVDWLCSKIEQSREAVTESSQDSPRLESGAPRIRIMTLHQSKGLEFGIVFMPFSAISPSQKQSKDKLNRYFDGRQRCLFYRMQDPDDDLAQKIQLEQDSESLRILYVGVTRARYHLILSYGWVNQIERCALTRVLLRDEPVKQAAIDQALSLFSEIKDRPILRIEQTNPVTEITLPYLQTTRSFTELWRISSFSSLHQSKEQSYTSPASDEVYAIRDSVHNPYKGAAFGNAMHYVLEHAQTADWQVRSVHQLNDNCKQLALAALIEFGYDQLTAESGVSILCSLVFDTLHGLLPEGLSLLHIRPENKRHELEFHFSLMHVNNSAVLSLIQQYGYCLNRQHFGFQKKLHGLLTGKIDLIFSHNNRFFIVDYKSNVLMDYQPQSMANSIAAQEYDLQYLLYSVALHRFLKHKMGSAYSFAEHFGGVRYLYARGMRAGTTAGIFTDRPNQELIEQLDVCFGSLARNSNVA